MRTVLVIDDNPAVPQALELLFGLHDIRSIAATSPEQGLELLARERIDLVQGYQIARPAEAAQAADWLRRPEQFLGLTPMTSSPGVPANSTERRSGKRVSENRPL